MPSRKLLMHWAKVEETIEQLVGAISDRGLSKALQELKEGALTLEILEAKDYKQWAMEEDDLPQ